MLTLGLVSLAKFFAVLPRGIWILYFAISTLLTFYFNTFLGQNQNQVPWCWQVSSVVLCSSFIAFALGPAFRLVDIGLELDHLNLVRHRQVRIAALEDEFFAGFPAHQIEACAPKSNRLGTALMLAQQRQGA